MYNSTSYRSLTEPCIFRVEAVIGSLDFSFRCTYLHDFLALGSFLYRHIVTVPWIILRNLFFTCQINKPFLWIPHMKNQTLLLANFLLPFNALACHRSTGTLLLKLLLDVLLCLWVWCSVAAVRVAIYISVCVCVCVCKLGAV